MTRKIKVTTTVNVEGEVVVKHEKLSIDSPAGHILSGDIIHSIQLYRKNGGLLGIIEKNE